jgi:hypothetical protein
MFTLAQLSYWNAKHLGDTGLEAMKDRGRIQIGKVADFAIFDPEKVAPRASYKLGENGLPPVGMPYVVVNGTIVVKDSEVLDVRPGQSIRFPVEAKGRFQPVEINKWIGQHSINVPDMQGYDDTGAGKVMKEAKDATPEKKETSMTPPSHSAEKLAATRERDKVISAHSWFSNVIAPNVPHSVYCPDCANPGASMTPPIK